MTSYLACFDLAACSAAAVYHGNAVWSSAISRHQLSWVLHWRNVAAGQGPVDYVIQRTVSRQPACAVNRERESPWVPHSFTNVPQRHVCVLQILQPERKLTAMRNESSTFNPLLHELFFNFSWNHMLPIGNICNRGLNRKSWSGEPAASHHRADRGTQAIELCLKG